MALGAVVYILKFSGEEFKNGFNPDTDYPKYDTDISSSEINVVPSQHFNFGSTGTNQDQYSDCGDSMDRKFLFVLKRGKNLINAHIFGIIKKPFPHRFVEMLDFCEWIGSFRHFLEQICIFVKPAAHREFSICERTPVSKWQMKTNYMSSPDIGKLMTAEARYENAAQNVGVLFHRPWFQVRLDVKFTGLCKIIESHGALLNSGILNFQLRK